MAIGTTDNPDGNNTAAAELTRDQVANLLVAPLQQRATFLAAGPRIFDTDGSPVRIPKAPESVADDLGWTGENEQITEVDPDFDELKLLPTGMQSVKTITRFSNELARQAVIGLDAALQDRLVTDVATKLDTRFLSDSGDGTETPKGLFAYTESDGVQTSDATSWDLDAIMDAQGLALAANVNPDNLALFIRPDDFMTIRKATDDQGHYLLTPDPRTGGLVVPLLGAGVYVSNHVPENRGALVDMSQIAVARDMTPTVRVLRERYADYDQQAIRVVARMDMKPIHPAAVILFDTSAA